jgi:hypothetical protein
MTDLDLKTAPPSINSIQLTMHLPIQLTMQPANPYTIQESTYTYKYSLKSLDSQCLISEEMWQHCN